MAFTIPTLLDVIGCFFMFFGLTQCSASICQMMHGLGIVIIAILSRIFLKKQQKLHHVLSIVLIMLSVAMVGYTGIK